MKVKVIAERLRSRSDELRRMSRYYQPGDRVSSDRALLVADVLAEVADQISPKVRRRR